MLFEPGFLLSSARRKWTPPLVPAPADELGTPYGALLQELTASPSVLLMSVEDMVKIVLQLASVPTSQTTKIVLYVFRLAAWVDQHIAYVIDYATQARTYASPLDIEVTDATLRELQAGQKRLAPEYSAYPVRIYKIRLH